MKAPHKAEHIFDEFSADYQAALKDDLEAIILFGSAARGDYTRNRSDINFLIVLSERGLEQLDLLTSLAAKWRKRKVATPLYMSGTEICSSLDSYPIEFLNMKRHYQIIYGKDVLAGLEFNPEHMRLQCERELKGKALLLLQRYTETDRNQKKIGVLIAVSITAFLSVFRALLYLKNISIPSGRRELVRATAEHYGIDMQTFIKCLDIKEGLLKFSKEEMRTLFQAYLSEIRKLAQQVDQTICYKQGGGK